MYRPRIALTSILSAWNTNSRNSFVRTFTLQWVRRTTHTTKSYHTVISQFDSISWFLTKNSHLYEIHTRQILWIPVQIIAAVISPAECHSQRFVLGYKLIIDIHSTPPPPMCVYSKPQISRRHDQKWQPDIRYYRVLWYFMYIYIYIYIKHSPSSPSS
jgi:hypothetical protein